LQPGERCGQQSEREHHVGVAADADGQEAARGEGAQRHDRHGHAAAALQRRRQQQQQSHGEALHRQAVGVLQDRARVRERQHLHQRVEQRVVGMADVERQPEPQVEAGRGVEDLGLGCPDVGLVAGGDRFEVVQQATVGHERDQDQGRGHHPPLQRLAWLPRGTRTLAPEDRGSGERRGGRQHPAGHGLRSDEPQQRHRRQCELPEQVAPCGEHAQALCRTETEEPQQSRAQHGRREHRAQQCPQLRD
jgi:hypothetical protein